jgi:hypothetical protein
MGNMSRDELVKALAALFESMPGQWRSEPRPARRLDPDHVLTPAERSARWRALNRDMKQWRVERTGTRRHCEAEGCGAALEPEARSDARYCSPACRQQAYRDRRRLHVER